MNVRALPLILALVVVFIGIAAWLFTARTHAQTPNPSNDLWQAGGPSKVIDNTARSVSRDSETSVRELTEAVFSVYPHVFGKIPAPFDNAIKDALTRAEFAHLQGKSQGVSEHDVANLVNMWADRLHLPEYAKTSVKQVRVLRMSLAVASPVFMGRGITDLNGISDGANAPEMSPLQAAHLAAVLVDQKFLDPDYQVTPQEWEQQFYEKQMEKIKRQRELSNTSGDNQTHAYSLMARSNPKHDEMRQAFSHGLAALGPADGFDLMNSSLAMLGVQR